MFPSRLVSTVLILISTLVTMNRLEARDLVVAYVPNWVDLKTYAQKIDYSKLTHINIAFENPTNDQGDFSFHPGNTALLKAAHARKVKVLVSIGGGGASSNAALKTRYFNLITEGKRGAFVKKLVDYVESHGFDGLDVDLEGPAINQDYGAFVHDLSLQLRPKGKLLTAALSRGYGGKSVPDSVFEDFDFINVMAYDGSGPWRPNDPGPHSSLEFSKQAVQYWLGRGLPASKTVLGVPFYGYGFGKAFRRGGYRYAEILAKYPEAADRDQVGETIWYNGAKTIEAKCRYVTDHKLAGIMIWSLNQDADGEASLLKVINQTLTRGTK